MAPPQPGTARGAEAETRRTTFPTTDTPVDGEPAGQALPAPATCAPRVRPAAPADATPPAPTAQHSPASRPPDGSGIPSAAAASSLTAAAPASNRQLGPPKPAALRVRGLVAGWDPLRPPVLRGLDLELAAGERLAVVGPSGGGKSTLAAVLARLLDPRAGTVTLGGDDLMGLDDRAVRRRVGLVSEDADHVFAATVRANLLLARPGASDGELYDVLERVGLDFDLDGWLGTGGSTISGGQRKRLATARALLAEPELLILDEPTEGLDAAGAEALMADLLAATGGRTVLVLTHRTEGLDRVDQVRRLDDHTLTAVIRSSSSAAGSGFAYR